MVKTKPPKLDLGTCEDKKEAVELWLDQFNDWCILQGFRDTTKPTSGSKALENCLSCLGDKCV